MVNSKVQPIKSASLMTQAFEQIRNAIFSGEFLPGEPLRELHLARDLQVSQVVVREALVKLEHLGLVVRESNRSTMVTKLTNKEIAERLAIREQLEVMAFVEAAPRVTDADIAELKRISREIASALEKKDYFSSAQADLSFHRYVWERADNETLYQTLNNVTVPLFAFVSILRRSGLTIFKDPLDPHEKLVTALKSNREHDIKAAIHAHVNVSYDSFLKSGIRDFEALARKIA